MDDDIGFTLADILQFFALKNGKVAYNEIVTSFKHALSNPATQEKARNAFKDYVNKLATVTHENNTKYLVLRPKFMRKLFNTGEEGDDSLDSTVASVPSPQVSIVNLKSPQAQLPPAPTPLVASPAAAPAPNGHVPPVPAHLPRTPLHPIICSPLAASSTSSFPYDSLERNVPSSVVMSGQTTPNSVVESSAVIYLGDDSEAPPRPPPRKKASFSKGSKSPGQMAPPPPPVEDSENSNLASNVPTDKTNLEVKKEIQELARTPGRVKEQAQSLNKLVESADCKVPIPTSTPSSKSVHTQVVNKIRNGYPGNDCESVRSLQICDSLKKKWIIAASACDLKEISALLNEDPHLASYCDFISGFSALHWAAKFNKPDIVRLLAGKYAVDPNCKSFSGQTPLHLACTFHNDIIIDLLTQVYGVNTEIRDNYGKKALQYLEAKEKKPNERASEPTAVKAFNEKRSIAPSKSSEGGGSSTAAMENPRIFNLRNKISHQSMLVRNKFRQSKAQISKRKASFSAK